MNDSMTHLLRQWLRLKSHTSYYLKSHSYYLEDLPHEAMGEENGSEETQLKLVGHMIVTTW